MTLQELRAELDKTTDWQQRQTMFARLGMASRAMDVLAEVKPELTALTKWHGHLVEWRHDFSNQLLAGALNENALRLSIARIDRDLDLVNEGYPDNLPIDNRMREAGYVPLDAVARAHGAAWSGSLPKVERRLVELRKRRDQAEADIAYALQDDIHSVRESDGVENHVS